MDNYHFDIIANGEVDAWVECCVNGSGNTAVGWSERENDRGVKRLVFYWVDPGKLSGEAAEAGYTKLPYPHDAKQIAAVIKGWLDQVKYHRQPDHDGDNGKGFRLYNEAWGHVDKDWQAFLAVSPAWAMYGK